MVQVLVNFPLLSLELQRCIAFFFDLVLVRILCLEPHLVHLERILVNLHLLFLFSYAQCGVHHLLVTLGGSGAIKFLSIF